MTLTPAKRRVLRDTLCARLPMVEDDEALRAHAMIAKIDMPALWQIHGLSEEGHPHSEAPGKPYRDAVDRLNTLTEAEMDRKTRKTTWPGDGSDYSDLPPKCRAEEEALDRKVEAWRRERSAAMGNTDRAQVKALGKGEGA